MQSKELKDWTRDQLMSKSARLSGEIDGLVHYRRSQYEVLEKTVQDISNLEELRRSVDIGQDQDTLEHLRRRELDLREEVRDLSEQIDHLSEELEPIEHELAGRPFLDDAFERRIESSRRETEKQLKRIRNEHLGVWGRFKVWLIGR
jgi:valyl-tRNA synthetase